MVIVNEPQLPCLHPWDQLSFVTTTTTATWVYGVWPISYPTHSTIQRCHPTLHGRYNPACFHLVWTSDLMARKDRSQSHVVVTAEGGTNFKSCLVGRSLNPAPAIFLLDNARHYSAPSSSVSVQLFLYTIIVVDLLITDPWPKPGATMATLLSPTCTSIRATNLFNLSIYTNWLWSNNLK